MKKLFSIPFFQKFQYFNDPIQLSIKFKPKIKELLNFFEIYHTYPINIIISNLQQTNTTEMIKIFNIIKEKYPNTNFIAGFPQNLSKHELQNLKKDFPIPIYSRRIITSLEDFNDLITIGVSDIFIGGTLGFYLKDLHTKAVSAHCKLRTYCNFSFNSSIFEDPLKSFFIRPDDIDFYSKYIDIFQFFQKENSDLNSLNTYYEIYAQDKKWFGPLNEIIINYQGDDDNRFILPIFATMRSNCKKRCAYQSNTCQICNSISSLSKSLQQKKLFI